MLEAHGLHFAYRTGSPILQGVDIDLVPGSFLAILGVNGCGKSTLLSCLTGAAKPASGQVLLDGAPLGQVHRLDRARKVAFVAQHSHANRLTVYDAVLLGRRPHMQGGPSKEDRQIVENVLERLGLAKCELRYTDELSGGEYQKMVLARAFVQRADTLLLDEPTKGMDGAFKAEFGALLRTLCAQGTAVCIVSHDVEFCAQYADRCGLLFRGEVVTENDPRAFFSGNYFYTTAAARIARTAAPGAVLCEEVVQCLAD